LADRSTERRDCPDYQKCFDETAYAGKRVVPCKNCEKHKQKMCPSCPDKPVYKHHGICKDCYDYWQASITANIEPVLLNKHDNAAPILQKEQAALERLKLEKGMILGYLEDGQSATRMDLSKTLGIKPYRIDILVKSLVDEGKLNIVPLSWPHAYVIPGGPFPPPKPRKEYEKTEIQRATILAAMEQIIQKEGVATQQAIAERCKVSIENLRYHLKKMAKEQIIKINPPNFRDGLESSTVEYLTPPLDATLPDKASQGDNLTEKAGKDALVDEKERKVAISLHSTAPAPEPIFVAGQRLPEKEAAIIREKINMTSPEAPGDAIMPEATLTPAPEPEASSAPGRISAAPEKSADPALRNIAISVNKAIEVALLEQVILMEKLKEFDSLRERIRRLEQFIEAAQKLMSEW